uniref:Galectin n=1 Tax=Latimeria chalumnae TaxID=7897 RepID=H3A5K9_LATCH
PVPYEENIPGGLYPKWTVTLRGYIPEWAQGFDINLQKSSSGELALHISIRLHDRTVVRNSHLKGGWGEEERGLPMNPFQRGQYFDMLIRCGNDRFKVFVNGRHLFNYNHRFRPVEEVDTLGIPGDIVLINVQF